MSNIQINISGNGTTTLATAGKYCDRNIDVNVTGAGGSTGGSAFWSEDAVRSFIGGGMFTPIFPAGLTRINSYRFYSCTFSLANNTLALPEGITYIGTAAFSYCTGADTVILPSTLTSIGSSAFMSCSSLKSITFKSTPSGMNSATFNGCSNLRTINVPWAEGAVANAPWGATKATINYNVTA